MILCSFPCSNLPYIFPAHFRTPRRQKGWENEEVRLGIIVAEGSLLPQLFFGLRC